jgi:hypothetical protein
MESYPYSCPLDMVIALLVDAEGVNAEVLAAVDIVSVCI